MAITPPVPIDAGPALPSSSDSETTFDAAFEAFLSWQKTQLQPQTNDLAANVYSNAQAAEAAATAAENSASAAASSATAAASSTTAAAASASSAQVAAAAAGAAAGLPSLAGKALQVLRVKSDETAVEWAPGAQFQRRGVFSAGAGALVPVSSGEQVLPMSGTGTGTGTTSLLGVGRANSLFIAFSNQPDRVATAASAAGPWTVRTFTSAGAATSLGFATDGTNSVLAFGGVTATRKSSGGIAWTAGGALSEAAQAWTVPAYNAGAWLVKTITATTVNRSTDNGATWAAATLPSAPLENKIFSLAGSFVYLTISSVVSSSTGATGSWTTAAHNLEINISSIAQHPNGDVSFMESGTGQMYLMTSAGSITKLDGVVCPQNHKAFRINGVWMFVPSSASASPNGTGYTVHGGVTVPRSVLASLFTSHGAAGLLPQYVEFSGQTILPAAQTNGVNAPVLVVNHSASPEAYFGA